MELLKWMIANNRLNDKSISLCEIVSKYKSSIKKLEPHIEKFNDLAVIEKYDDIKDVKSITIRLADAYSIMKDSFIPNNMRCKPCEMEALCAIKEIVNKKMKCND